MKVFDFSKFIKYLYDFYDIIRRPKDFVNYAT